MLKTELIHPEILAALAAAGHGSTILIADANYPIGTATSERAKQVFLNLSPGLISVPDILAGVLSAVPVEAAFTMRPAEGPEPVIFEDFHSQLSGLELTALSREAFYSAARAPELALAIASGDQRLFGNILLTIGVMPEMTAAK